MSSGVKVDRQVVQQSDLRKRRSFVASRPKIPDCCKANYCSWRRCCHFLYRLFPILELTEEYHFRRDIPTDLLTGLTIGFIQISQSLAYASLANVAPVCGIYTAFFSPLLYFVFGSSRQACTGAFAIACLIAGDIIASLDKMHHYDNEKVSKIMAAICIVTGIYQFIFFVLQWGKLTHWLSETLINSFSVACSFHIMFSQIPDILGFKISPRSGYFRILKTCEDIGGHIKSFNYVTFLIALSCLAILFTHHYGLRPYLGKKCPIQIPVELILMLIGILVSYLMDLENNYGVILVGHIPMGFVAPIVTTFEYMKLVAVNCIAIAIVSYIMSVSIILYFSKKGAYSVRPNQDALALGIMNIVGGFFYCIPTSVSLVRTMIAHNMNAVSQLFSLFSCVIVCVVIMWGGYLFRLLPRCLIATIIISASVRTFKDFDILKYYWQISKADLAIWLITFLVVTLIDIVIGFAVGIGMSILAICYQSFRTDSCLLGVIPGTELYLDLRRFRQCQEIPDIKIFRYAGAVNFATRQLFRKSLEKAVGVSARDTLIHRNKEKRKLKEGETLPEFSFDFKIIILDFARITNIDYQGIGHLKQLLENYEEIGITTLMASPHDDVYESFMHIIAVSHYDDKYPFFPTVHDAVTYGIDLLKN